MTVLREELIDDLESVDEVTELDEYEEEEDEEAEPQRQPQSNQLKLQALVAEQKATIADLNKRLGNATETLGKRLKDRDREVQDWLDQINPWAESQVQAAKAEGFAEGKSTVEDRLLNRLGVEERAAYLEELRRNQPAPSPRTVERLDTRRTVRPSETNEDLNDLVQEFLEQGVPLDQLEQTSARAVVSSGTKWLKAQVDPEVRSTRQTRQREESGEARVSNGGGTSRPLRSSDQKRLDEITSLLTQMKGKSHSLDKATKLLNEKKLLEGRLRRRST